MNTFFAVRVLFCSIYVLFPRVLHEYGRITTVHERYVTEEVFMYSLWSNYIYIHRELWHYSKKPFLFQALEIVSQVLTGFFRDSASCRDSPFSGTEPRLCRVCAWNAGSLSPSMPSFSSAMRFCSHGTPGSIPNSGPAFLCAVCSAISCGWTTPF